MNTVSDVLGNAGAPIQATIADGRVLTFRRFVQADRTKIEQLLKGHAKSQLLEDRHEMSDEEYGKAYEAFLRLVSSSEFKYGGTVFAKFLQSGAGSVYLMRILGRWENGKELTEDDIAAMTREDAEAMKLSVSQALAESFPKATAPAPGPGTSAPAGPLAL